MQEFANKCFGDVKYALNILVNNFKNFYTSRM